MVAARAEGLHPGQAADVRGQRGGAGGAVAELADVLIVEGDCPCWSTGDLPQLYLDYVTTADLVTTADCGFGSNSNSHNEYYLQTGTTSGTLKVRVALNAYPGSSSCVAYSAPGGSPYPAYITVNSAEYADCKALIEASDFMTLCE